MSVTSLASSPAARSGARDALPFAVAGFMVAISFGISARAAGMPAYVICNDRTLVEIASARPTTTAQLLSVHGMGEVKVGRFGPELLALVGAKEG